MPTCVFAMCHHLVLTPSQETRRARRRARRADKAEQGDQDAISIKSTDSDFLEELARQRVQKQRRLSGVVKAEPESPILDTHTTLPSHTHTNTQKHTCTYTVVVVASRSTTTSSTNISLSRNRNHNHVRYHAVP